MSINEEHWPYDFGPAVVSQVAQTVDDKWINVITQSTAHILEAG